MTSAEQDERWNVEVGNLPLRSSELDSEAFAAQVKNYPGLEVMAANSANAKNARPTIKGYVWVSESIGHAISEVLQGAAEPKAALDAAAAESNGQLE